MKTKSMREAFHTVYRHLMTQNVKSFDATNTFCQYRGEAGCKCAVGCLISDEHYVNHIENHRVNSPAVLKAIHASGYSTSKKAVELYTQLQRIHDTWNPPEWQTQLNLLTKEFSVTIPREYSKNALKGTKVHVGN